MTPRDTGLPDDFYVGATPEGLAKALLQRTEKEEPEPQSREEAPGAPDDDDVGKRTR